MDATRVASTLAWTLAFAYSFAPFEFALHWTRLQSDLSLAEPITAPWLLSLPLHFLTFLALGVIDRVWNRSARPSAWTLARGITLCALIEIGQIFCEGRHAELLDAGLNVAGFVLGYLYVPLSLAARARTRTVPSGSSVVRWLVWGTLWSSTVLAAAFVVSLDRWDPTYRLHVGNEEGVNRGWHGHLWFLAIYDRALTPEEIASLAAHPPDTREGAAARARAGLILAYDFTRPDVFTIDPTGPLASADLVLTIPRNAKWLASDRPALIFDGSSIVSSTGSAHAITEHLVATKRFSIETLVSTTSTIQAGPARIVGISGSEWVRNVTLGQEEHAIHLRVRNRVNGKNGFERELRCADAISEGPTSIVATYDYGLSAVYSGGASTCPATDLRPPSVVLGLGPHRIGGAMAALLAALSLLALNGRGPSLLRLLTIGYAWLLLPLAVAAWMSFEPGTTLQIWFGPWLVVFWWVLSERQPVIDPSPRV